jgi:hypothetical protein
MGTVMTTGSPAAGRPVASRTDGRAGVANAPAHGGRTAAPASAAERKIERRVKDGQPASLLMRLILVASRVRNK